MSFGRAPKKKQPLDEVALYEYAIGALGRRMRTVAELKRAMRARVEENESGEAKIDRVVARLKEQRYLNDTIYASDYARLRQENSSFGKRRVQQDLIQKGVHANVIAKTLDAAYENVNEEELARQHLTRKRVRKPANEKEAARVMRMLVRAGFSTGVIFKILKKWDVDDEALSALESIDIEDNAGAE
ncbi:RecX family transcriptional regulator [Alloacidobacterium dinghuense]|uniref:Regulatory protein RecX n=1 Tax=Alloacidobacterium dinghuense TaxID=2763107 RepID=A0A7G8BHL2_9BACT|nr:regulatory protein RecX [Alloacidobacterium dinghuense]QNI32032.1 RecX family transcriptional regulator [Alloacidobacterium dinghuense]